MRADVSASFYWNTTDVLYPTGLDAMPFDFPVRACMHAAGPPRPARSRRRRAPPRAQVVTIFNAEGFPIEPFSVPLTWPPLEQRGTPCGRLLWHRDRASIKC